MVVPLLEGGIRKFPRASFRRASMLRNPMPNVGSLLSRSESKPLPLSLMVSLTRHLFASRCMDARLASACSMTFLSAPWATAYRVLLTRSGKSSTLPAEVKSTEIASLFIRSASPQSATAKSGPILPRFRSRAILRISPRILFSSAAICFSVCAWLYWLTFQPFE